jgi:protein tyrosine phosphatase (PTP) superfamily phosphohydrolase (DUF442 family)
MKSLRSVLPLLVTAVAAHAAGLDGISNYLEYSDRLSSSGQPTVGELELLSEAGFERVVYIAFTDHENALPSEDRLVKALGMDYLQLPVDWTAPTPADFYQVAAALRAAPQKRTLLHCQVNYRASAFSFLYRVIYEKVPIEEAKRDMQRVWQPNEIWQDYIDKLLAENGISRGNESEEGQER